MPFSRLPSFAWVIRVSWREFMGRVIFLVMFGARIFSWRSLGVSYFPSEVPGGVSAFLVENFICKNL